MRQLLAVLVLAFVAYGQTQEKAPTLDKTIDYMSSVLETAGGDQKIIFGADYRKEPCRLFVADTITYSITKPAKVYKTEVQFHLGTIDPKSVKVESLKSGGIQMVRFETTDYDPVIWESASKWEETHGRIPKSLELVRFPSYHFRLYNPEAANHFAKAFVHAIELCGGKKSSF